MGVEEKFDIWDGTQKLMENKSAETSASKSAMYLAGATTNGHLNSLALV